MKQLLYILILIGTGLVKAQKTFPINGIRDERNLIHAYVNATVIVNSKITIQKATILIKESTILEVGTQVTIPKDAVIHDCLGKFIYPSFIDPYTQMGVKKEPLSKGIASAWNLALRTDVDALRLFTYSESQAENWRKAGFGLVQTFHADGIARGNAIVVSTASKPIQEIVMLPQSAALYSFKKGTSNQDYPSSLMGAIALIRQTYYDALWYATQGYKEQTNLGLKRWNELQNLQQYFETQSWQQALMAAAIAKEFNKKYVVVGSGDEYQRIDELKKTGFDFIIPVNFPKPFRFHDLIEGATAELSDLQHWLYAPSNPAFLQRNNINFSFTANGLKEPAELIPNIKKAIQAGLSSEMALKALTETPAQLLNLSSKTGSIEKGKWANFFIASDSLMGDFFALEKHVVLGNLYEVKSGIPQQLVGVWKFQTSDLTELELSIDRKGKMTFQRDSVKISGQLAVSSNNELAFHIDSKKLGTPGKIELTGKPVVQDSLVSTPSKSKKDAPQITNYQSFWPILEGYGVLPNSKTISWKATWVKPLEAKPDTAKKKELAIYHIDSVSITFPMGAYGMTALPNEQDYVIKNTTVWTNTADGIIQQADVLVSKGKIMQIRKTGEKEIATSPNLQVIDGSNKHLTNGIIDEHSHIAVQGDVNEGSQNNTAEVRIGDVINPTDINIYRQLSGGVTTSHLLHGSANPIGGQNAVIKLRWGATANDMVMKESPGHIKFALGENVKQSNWGDHMNYRYPQTRMGVEQVYFDAFDRAKQYQKDKKSKNPAFRTDLELEAIAEILEGKRNITCHSYIQSEINMLMKVADSMGFKVNTFTHILEGYKVADKMKAHGANASTFSDWWAYKWEVNDAIPYNAALTHRMGITTGINSDDAEMARRLNQEAAKAIRYGGLSEEEAWKLVTLNPAKMLKIDQYVGSISVGKQADLVLWTNNPLSIYATVDKTWVDGKLYFNRDDVDASVKKMEAEKIKILMRMQQNETTEKDKKPIQKKLHHLYHCDDVNIEYLNE